MSDTGSLNAWDRRLLERYLDFYQSLDSGVRQPTTPAQNHFLEVCRQRAQPKTQHEIAYTKFLEIPYAERAGAVEAQLAHRGPAAVVDEVAPSDGAINAVNEIQKATFDTVSEYARGALGKIAEGYRAGWAKAQNVSVDAGLWASTLLSSPDLTGSIERWTGDAFGGLSDVYTRALDGAFLEGLRPGADYVAPWLHRLFEGHSLPASFAAVREALPSDSFSEEVIGWLRALASDVVTPGGLPFVELNPSQYEALRGLAETFYVPEAWLRDCLSYTATELVASMIPALALAMNWSERDAESFARLAGGLGVGAVVSANPVLAAISLAALARAFHLATLGDKPGVWAKAVAKGGLASGLLLTATAALGGPATIGLLVGAGLLAGASRLPSASRLREFIEWLRHTVEAIPSCRPAVS